MEKRKRYSIQVKVLILFGLIVSTVMAGITGSWIFLGLCNGLTWKETLQPQSYEESQAVGYYLFSEAYSMLENIEAEEIELISQPDEAPVYLIQSDEPTNELFYIKNVDTDTVYTNVGAWGTLSLDEIIEEYGKAEYSAANRNDCYLAKDATYTAELGTVAVMSEGAKEHILNYLEDEFYDGTVMNCRQYQMFVGLNTNYPVRGSYAYERQSFYQSYLENCPKWSSLFYVLVAVTIWLLVLVGRQAGHNDKDMEIHTNELDRFPIELWIISDIILIVISVLFFAYNDWSYYSTYNVGSFLGDCIPFTAGALLLTLTFAKMLNLYLRRIKAKTLGGSIIKNICKGISKCASVFYQSRKENQKLILRYLLVVCVNIILFLIAVLWFLDWNPVLGFITLIILAILDVYMLYRLVKNAKGKDEIRKGLAAIAQGNLDYQIDTTEMSAENREMGEEVNRVRNGLKLAVEAQIKSERLKTDLIANVSHDIKTPLTSIINYVDILKRENIEDEKIAGYIDILDRKSGRLKQLTEDLIEVSKISSGNISLNMEEINLKQLIKQTNGEFAEKFAVKNLQLVCNLPEQEMLVRADGRRMYRVIENLYNNAAKYAMPSSRVYVTGELRDGKVIFSMKNMSEHLLNVSADELMERFVRGDTSRTTEGSGLGLEIARNLTVMQNGTFDLYLDGDLFKVTITFADLKSYL